MTWAVPSGASSVTISAISADGGKLLGTRFDNGVETPWAWTSSGGNTNVVGFSASIFGHKASPKATLAVYPPATTASGTFAVWDGATYRTFQLFAGYDSLHVQAVSPNGDCAVVAGQNGTTWSLAVVSNILSHLAANTGVNIRSISAPSGYNQYLYVRAVTNSGVAYGSASPTSNIQSVFYSNAPGAVSIISDSAYETGYASIAPNISVDRAGGDAATYGIDGPVPALRTFSIAGGVVDITPTYGAFPLGYDADAATVYGAMYTASSTVPARYVAGNWEQLAWSGVSPFGVALWGYDGTTLVNGADDGSVGNTRVRFYTDSTTYTELALPAGWPAGASASVVAFSDDLSALVLSCDYYDAETNSWTTGSYLWTATDGYVSLASAVGSMSASLSATSTASANLHTGASFSATLSSASALTASFSSLALFSAGLTSEATISSNLLLPILLSAGLSSTTNVGSTLATQAQFFAELVSSTKIAAGLGVGAGFAASLASRTAIVSSLKIGVKAALQSGSIVSAELSTQILLRAALQSSPVATYEFHTQILCASTIYSHGWLTARLQTKPPRAREESVSVKTPVCPSHVLTKRPCVFAWSRRT